MIEFNILFLKIILILGLFILAFIYSIISSDLLVTLLCLFLYLIFFFPFFLLIEKLRILLFLNNLEEIPYIKFFLWYSTIIVIIIGTFLFIQFFYLLFFA